MKELQLKYGCNPNQKPARIFMQNGKDLPVAVLNGHPGSVGDRHSHGLARKGGQRVAVVYISADEVPDSRDRRMSVTNGDQTDTVFEGLSQGKTFSESLESRCFEPDFPNFTPRISV